MPEPEARERLRRAGIALAPCKTVTTSGEAQAAFRELGGPVAMKLVSAKAPHKSDVGGVILDVESEESTATAFARLMAVARGLGADDARVLMSPMIGEGVECLIGGTLDRKFGPVISFGAGGVLVELIEDVTFRLAPVDQAQARDMIESSRIFPLLKGYRGRKPADLAALIDLLTAASRFLAETPGLTAFDLNPVIVNQTGAHIADVRILAATRGGTVRKEKPRQSGA